MASESAERGGWFNDRDFAEPDSILSARPASVMTKETKFLRARAPKRSRR